MQPEAGVSRGKEPALLHAMTHKTVGCWMRFDGTYGNLVRRPEKGTFESATCARFPRPFSRGSTLSPLRVGVMSDAAGYPHPRG